MTDEQFGNAVGIALVLGVLMMPRERLILLATKDPGYTADLKEALGILSDMLPCVKRTP